jgi:hypothetical protein
VKDKCPVCCNTVTRNENDRIRLHRDKLGTWCPASGAPIYICKELLCKTVD